MEIHRFRPPAGSAQQSPAPDETVLTIGNFDGVHVGHQALIRQVVREAREAEVRSALMTFHPHPQSVLRPDPPPMLTSEAQRLRLFEQLGLDTAYVIPFTRAFAQLTPEAFVREHVLAHVRVRKLVIGFDFHFGRNRQGSAAVLERLSAAHGFDFEIFPAVALDGAKVSSSAIREALQRTDFAAAERLLGRPYGVLQPIVRGRQQGRQLGFPTLNQVPGQPLPLPYGVYATRVLLGEQAYEGVSNYGLRPTVNETDPAPTLETFVFEFDRQVYGELVEVLPLLQLRAERKFPSLDALKAQIALDRDAARDYFAGREGAPR